MPSSYRPARSIQLCWPHDGYVGVVMSVADPISSLLRLKAGIAHLQDTQLKLIFGPEDIPVRPGDSIAFRAHIARPSMSEVDRGPNARHTPAGRHIASILETWIEKPTGFNP